MTKHEQVEVMKNLNKKNEIIMVFFGNETNFPDLKSVDFICIDEQNNNEPFTGHS